MESNVLLKRWVQGSNVVVDDLRGTMFTGENGAHTFQISGVDSAQATVEITGTITGRFLTATNVTVPLTGSVSDGKAVLTLTEDCYVIPGRFVLSIYATNGSTTQCIYCAVGNVFRTQSDIIEYPSASIPDIEQIIADAQAEATQINAEVTAAQAAVAAAQTAVDGIEAQRQTMIASIASVAGQGTDTTLSQSGVAADAKAAGDAIGDLKSAFDTNYTYTKVEGAPPWVLGYYINTAEATVDMNAPVSANMMYLAVECSPNDIFRVSGKGGNAARLWAFTDANYNILTRADAGTQKTDLMLVAPDTAAHLIVNVDVATQPRGVWVGKNTIETDTKTNTDRIDALFSEKIIEQITGNPPWVTGKYINLSGTTVNLSAPVTAEAEAYLTFSCLAGDVLRISGKGGNAARLWAFVDENNNIISKAEANIQADNLILTAPENTAYLVVNVDITATPRGVYKVSDHEFVSSDYLFESSYEKVRVQGAPPWVFGQYINTSGETAGISSPVTESSMMYIDEVCTPGDVFEVSGKGGNAARLWAFTDADYNVIQRELPGYEALNKKITAPASATHLIVNTAVEYGQRGLYRYIKKDNNHIRFLVLGNSYSADWCSYVPFILKNVGVTCEIYHYVRDRLTLRDLYNRWESSDAQDVETDDPAGTYPRNLYYIDTRTMGAWTTLNRMSAKQLVELGKWDFITMQQSVHYVNDPTSYTPYLPKIIQLINTSADAATPLAWVGVITKPADDNKETNLSVLENTVMGKWPFSFLIPEGTTIFNCRSNTALAQIGSSQYHNFWSGDDIHLQDGLPRYAAALAAVQAIIQYIFPTKSVMFDKFRITTALVNTLGVIQPHTPVVGITDDNCLLTQQAAVLANKYPYVITTIDSIPT